MSKIIDIANEVIKQVDIVDIISRYINVIKKGKNYVALCPFHDDSSPSMMISVDKQIFKCFVCNTGGNAITFVQDYEKITFIEALKKVCELAGIHTYDDEFNRNYSSVRKIDDSLEVLYNCAEELNNFYIYGLSIEEGKIALDYLHNRGISDYQIKKFGLGYSLADGEKTISYLQAKKFSLKNIEDIGIARARASGTSDNNAGRLIFPLKDAYGKTIGFSARRLVEDKEISKFINSPETQLFHKSNVLYNLHNALQTCKHDGYLYVVEGFMDVFAFDSIGINSCVALMGTAFTKENAQYLKKLNVEVRLCLDGDLPGQSAMVKAMQVLDKFGIKYRIVFEDGNILDPDEILKQKGEEALKSFANSLKDGFNFAISYYLRNGNNGSIDERKEIINRFMPQLVSITDDFMLNDCIAKLSKATNFEPSTIRSLIKKSKNSESIEEIDLTNPVFPGQMKQIKKLQLAERAMLIQMLNSDEAIDFFYENDYYFLDNIYRMLADLMLECKGTSGSSNVSDIVNAISINCEENKDQLINAVTELSNDINHPEYSEQFMIECYKKIVDGRNKQQMKSELQNAMLGKSAEDQAKLIDEYVKSKRNKKH